MFYFKEGKDISCHFALEQQTFTAIDRFIQHEKSKYHIEALEELQVFAISHDDLELLFNKHPKHEQFDRLFLQYILIDLVERIDDLQLYSAQERYDILLSKNPKPFKRAASKHIATYLGMTPKTFSRIRGK